MLCSTDKLSEFAYRTTVLTVTRMSKVSGADSIGTEVLGAPAKVIIKFWYSSGSETAATCC